MTSAKPALYTCFSPALLNLYEVKNVIVVVIDVLRATSTIATALHNGARSVIPVDNIPQCIALGESIGGITAGERDGKIAPGLAYGNSPFDYPPDFINDRDLVLTTTNGTKLLHMALEAGAGHIITGSFPNLSAVCSYLVEQQQPVILACAAWKDRINIEDTLFAGAVIAKIGDNFTINCDASAIALNLFRAADGDHYGFLKQNNASHYHRLTNFGLEKDLRYCLTPDLAPVLPFYEDERLVVHDRNKV